MKSQNSRNQGFSYFFCLMIETGSGSVPPTHGSRSSRPKKHTILQIRIRNTVVNSKNFCWKTDRGYPTRAPGWKLNFEAYTFLWIASISSTVFWNTGTGRWLQYRHSFVLSLKGTGSWDGRQYTLWLMRTPRRLSTLSVCILVKILYKPRQQALVPIGWMNLLIPRHHI
jgi:hypothetical protein